jgi:hypothetical protein
MVVLISYLRVTFLWGSLSGLPQPGRKPQGASIYAGDDRIALSCSIGEHYQSSVPRHRPAAGNCKLIAALACTLKDFRTACPQAFCPPYNVTRDKLKALQWWKKRRNPEQRALIWPNVAAPPAPILGIARRSEWFYACAVRRRAMHRWEEGRARVQRDQVLPRVQATAAGGKRRVRVVRKAACEHRRGRAARS